MNGSSIVRPPTSTRRTACLCSLAFLLLAARPGASRAAMNANELARVERLLVMIASRREMRLVRNGKDHDPDTAVAFLRGKLKAMGDDLSTAEDFIDRIATRSSTTGQLYRVRLPDGREIGAGEYLRIELIRLDKAAAGR